MSTFRCDARDDSAGHGFSAVMRRILSVAIVGGVIATTAACGGSTRTASQGAAAAATKTAGRSAR